MIYIIYIGDHSGVICWNHLSNSSPWQPWPSLICYWTQPVEIDNNHSPKKNQKRSRTNSLRLLHQVVCVFFIVLLFQKSCLFSIAPSKVAERFKASFLSASLFFLVLVAEWTRSFTGQDLGWLKSPAIVMKRHHGDSPLNRCRSSKVWGVFKS